MPSCNDDRGVSNGEVNQRRVVVVVGKGGRWCAYTELKHICRVCTRMNEVDHDRRRIRSGDGSVRSLDLECPQVSFWVLARAITQRQTGQEQHLLLMRHGTECRDVHSDGVDAVQVNTNSQ